MASEEQTNERQSEEYILLKERAKTLGLRVSPNIGLDALRLKVNGALTGGSPDEGEPDSDEDEGEDDEDENDDQDDDGQEVHDIDADEDVHNFSILEGEDDPQPTETIPMAEERVITRREERRIEKDLRRSAAQSVRRTGRETKLEMTNRLRAAAMKLVRCRIYNLNPGKRELHGEIITVGNKYVGTLKKLIPFGEATDNGYHIPQMIYDDLKQRRYQAITTRRVNGQIKVTSRMAPEYNIEVLPPLSKEELAELAMKQAAAERMQGKDD